MHVHVCICVSGPNSPPPPPLRPGDQTALYVSTRLVAVIEATEQFQAYASKYAAAAAAAAGTEGKKGKRKVANSEESLEERSPAYINTEEQLNLLSQAMVQAYINMDEELRQDMDVVGVSGSTCVCTIITPSHILGANGGDSRCVLGTGTAEGSGISSGGSKKSLAASSDANIGDVMDVETESNAISQSYVSLSEDHKPSLTDETTRIVNAGLFVLNDRVKGELAMVSAVYSVLCAVYSVMSCHVMLCYVTSCHVMSCHVVSCPNSPPPPHNTAVACPR